MGDPDPQGRESGGIQFQPPQIPDHELLRSIGRGSYGEVWLGRSIMGAYRAVKIVSRQSFEDDRPFEREFNGIQKFEPISRSHDSQVDILHVGRGDGFFYYVMELADDQQCGQDIEPATYQPKTLKSEVFRKGQLPVEQCLAIGLQLTTALNHLHSHGLIHRDIKPSNIIFVNGTPKLADIGLVTSVDATRSFVGTEGFLPPEGPGTQQGDIYSLGKVLYEILSGRDRNDFPELPTNLFDAADRERFLEMNSIVAKACALDLRERYRSTHAMQDDLLLLQRGQSVRRGWAFKRRLAKLVQIGAGLAVATLLAIGGYIFGRPQTDEAKQGKATQIGSVDAQAVANPTQIATMDPLTGALTVKSSDGGSLGFLAVSSANSPTEWWRPDGTPVTNGIVVRGNPKPGSDNDFFLLVDSRGVRGSGGINGEDEYFDPPGRRVYVSSVDQNGKLLLGVWAHRLRFAKSARTTNWRGQVGLEKWRTVSVLDPVKRQYTPSRKPGDPDFKVHWYDFIDSNGRLQATLTLRLNPKFWNSRITAVDTNGVLYRSHAGSVSPVENFVVMTFSGFRPESDAGTEPSETTQSSPKLSLADVKELRAEVEPVSFVEFRNIALSPASERGALRAK